MHRVHTKVLAVISALATAGLAQASWTPIFNNAVPAPGGNTRFTYEVFFSTSSNGGAPTERLEAGDFMTIYDIPGFVSAEPTGGLVTLITQNTGLTGPGTLPADDPTLTNVTLRYDGPPVDFDSLFNTLSIVSSFNATGTDNYTAQTHNFPNGTLLGHIGTVTVPAVPEPGALVFLGVLPLALARRR